MLQDLPTSRGLCEEMQKIAQQHVTHVSSADIVSSSLCLPSLLLKSLLPLSLLYCTNSTLAFKRGCFP